MTKMLVDMDVDNIASLVQQKLDEGTDPQSILEALTKGMNVIGDGYERQELFLAELVLAGETMKQAFKVIKPRLTVEKGGGRSPVVVATVKGDNHDIGKNILSTMLISAGFEIIDLGIDVSKETIIDAVKEHGAKVVALSCLLTMTIKEISLIEKALRDAGLRNDVKLIVGGAALSMELAKELGADDYGADAIDGVNRIRALLEG
ncbi:MAG: cobalamin B12-binding domain-containing protein [Candidatus Thorarchaeota archaeon]